MDKINIESNGKDTVTFIANKGNIICQTDMELRIGDPLVMENKWSNYPIMEDKFVVRGYKSDLDKQGEFVLYV